MLEISKLKCREKKLEKVQIVKGRFRIHTQSCLCPNLIEPPNSDDSDYNDPLVLPRFS